jgi:gamma-glutamyl phosphate reductase
MKDIHTSMMEQRSRSAALPDRLGLHEQMLSAHLDAVRRLKAAAEPLYASLSEEQKKAADEVISSMGMMAGMM